MTTSYSEAWKDSIPVSRTSAQMQSPGGFAPAGGLAPFSGGSTQALPAPSQHGGQYYTQPPPMYLPPTSYYQTHGAAQQQQQAPPPDTPEQALLKNIHHIIHDSENYLIKQMNQIHTNVNQLHPTLKAVQSSLAARDLQTTDSFATSQSTSNTVKTLCWVILALGIVFIIVQIIMGILLNKKVSAMVVAIPSSPLSARR